MEENLDKAWLDKVRAFDEDASRLKRGSCILAQPENARIVVDAIGFHRGSGLLLHAWCVMPNHVHAVVTTDERIKLNSWLESIKKFSARSINERSGRSGNLWERESFNHLVRTPAYFGKFCEYVEENPVAVGLCNTRDQWPHSSARPGTIKDALERFVSPYDTTYVAPRDRGELTHIIKEQGTYFVTFRLLDSVVLRDKR